MNTTANGATASLFLCRTCRVPAVRYVGGKRRTFYCGSHGPGKLADWSRLLPIPEQEYEAAGRILSLAPPLPPRIARLLDGLADGLRDALMQDLPAAHVADMGAVKALEAEVARLTAENERLAEELKVATDTALEAMEELVPATPGFQFIDGGGGPVAPPEPPPPAPKAEPAPKPGKGYRVHPMPRIAPNPPAPEPAPEADEPTPPSGFTPTPFSSASLDMLGFRVLAGSLKFGPRMPGLRISSYAEKDFASLTAANKRAVLNALEYLGVHPEVLREEHLFGFDNPPLYALRANRKIRLICQKGGGTYAVKRIVDRHSKLYYRNER